MNTNTDWLKALGIAALRGAVLAAAAMATTLAPSGFSLEEVKVLAAYALSGAFGGMAGMFQPVPRDPTKRERESD